MTIKRLIVGMVQTNCYLVMNDETKEAVIVDPGDRADMIETTLTQMGARPQAILLTHGHYDHAMAVEDLSADYDIPVYSHEEEAEVLKDPMINLAGTHGDNLSIVPDKLVKDGEVLHLAGYEITVIHTPGHTKGSCCYYFKDQEVLFAGDTLFEGSYGRIDFPTGSGRQIVHSVAEVLFSLPDEVQVFPGHMGYTTIGDEKLYNPLAGYRGKIK